MKTGHIHQIIHLVFILSLTLFAGSPTLVGQTIDWKTFENYLFGMANDAVQGKASGNEQIDELEKTLTAFMSQGQCPTSEVCESIRYIILTIRNLASGAGSREQQTAFLRQAVHSYTTNAQAPQQPAGQPVSYYTPEMIGVDVNYVYRSGGIGKFQPLEDGGEMHSGDHYKIMFEPDNNCYVYIFQVDTSGMIYGLFPLDNFRGVDVDLANPVREGELYFVPAEKKSFKLDRQTGPERFYFLVSHERDDALEQDYSHLVELQNSMNTGEMQIAQARFIKSVGTKGPAVIISDQQETETSSWQEDGQTFSVLKQRLTGSCDQCVNILTFMHR